MNRGRFLTSSASLAALAGASAQGKPVEDSVEDSTSLCGGWNFRIDGSTNWQPVTVPHTWQIVPETAEYAGIAWYRRNFDAPAHWLRAFVRIEFEAVYHTATVWLNGHQIGSHSGKGYTTFAFDCERALHAGTNELLVRVDNSFDDRMLPRNHSFDWTNDGGIIRPVRLVVTPRTYVERIDVESVVNLDARTAVVTATVHVRNTNTRAVRARAAAAVVEDETDARVGSASAPATSIPPNGAKAFVLPPITIGNPLLWHFDRPNLYRLSARIASDVGSHTAQTNFGLREFEFRGTELFLNGERVRLMGLERTGGSDPRYGMAEPASLLERDHDAMKDLNAVFTRVHWQQDRRMLDYCDRNGILVQQEVPAWGSETFAGMDGTPREDVMRNGLEQLREMILRDRNHPCIFSWGLCNEVDGTNPVAAAFVKRMYDEAKRLDPRRFVSYASNSLEERPERDVAGSMDFIGWNEYYESWYEGTLADIGRNLERIHRAYPDKPIVITEYGFCECKPRFRGGDARRREIIRAHTDAFAAHPYVCGAIFFDYSDYRTHIGDVGLGVLKQRVHGVVDLFGKRKPSYEALRERSSPVESLAVTKSGSSYTATVRTRGDLPSYTLAGYTLRWTMYRADGIPIEMHEQRLPTLTPGTQASFTYEPPQEPARIVAEVLRPRRFSVATSAFERDAGEH